MTVIVVILGASLVAALTWRVASIPARAPERIEREIAPALEGVVVCVDRERPRDDGKTWLELTVRVPREPLPSYLALGEIELRPHERIGAGDRVALEVDPANPVRVRITSARPAAS